MTTDPDEPVGPTELRRSRARPLSPQLRRQAILRATVPLVRRYGFDVSTRQIAEAAGVAEGTLFRVFDDKESLLQQAIEEALDPEESVRQLEALDPSSPLEVRIGAAVTILRQQTEHVFEIAAAVGLARFPDAERFREHSERLTAAIAVLFEPDADRLRYPAIRSARLLRMLAFAGAHPRMNEGHPVSAEEVATVLLHGVVRLRDEET